MMIIRPETPADYFAVAQINIRAFGQRLDEALIVALHRQHAEFDPDLSLVAEVDGQVVGHVLFTPHTIRLLNQDIRAVNLAPIAIDPPHQKQGIGVALIHEGHRIAKYKGYVLSFLVGHPPYYPRFGYHQHVYGASSLTVPTAMLTRPSHHHFETRLPREDDLPTLIELWRHEEGGIDFALVPGDSLLDWLSPNPMIEAAVYLRDKQIVGYTRIRSTEPISPLIFLASDERTAQDMAAEIGDSTNDITLPLHPYSASASAFGIAAPQMTTWDAAMVCPLASDILDDYMAQIAAGQRIAGRVIWSTLFDVG